MMAMVVESMEYPELSILSRVRPISLTPGFSQVDRDQIDSLNRFNGLEMKTVETVNII